MQQLCDVGHHSGIGQDGFYAPYAAIDVRGLARVPKGISPEVAAIATDAVATAYHAIYRRGEIKQTETVFLFGLGGLGFNALQLLLDIGARVVVSDIRPEILEEAAAIGVPKSDLVPVGEPVQKFVTDKGLTGKIDAVLDFVGTHQTFEDAQQIAWNDVEDGFQWLHANIAEIGGCPEKVVVGGISAGGQLTASLTLSQHLGHFGKELPLIAGQVLIIPCLVNPDCYDGHLKRLKHPAVSSYAENENAPILPRRMIDLFVGLLRIEKPDYYDLRLNPGNASTGQLKGMPPTTLGIAGLDPLRDEGLLYAKLLTESGVPTETHIFRGVPHGFRRFGDKLSESKHWDNVTDYGIKWALTKPTASGHFVIHEA
ncbi:AB hydrolase superfamily protein [Colletotrichum siamense]|nr:AB hydrolase superfamily protein [Colletotrichum siamense]KAF4879624.1 AB hydrolase superfamily protein [Colletotrichum siamense]